jgi:hypothetical protein
VAVVAVEVIQALEQRRQEVRVALEAVVVAQMLVRPLVVQELLVKATMVAQEDKKMEVFRGVEAVEVEQVVLA